MNWGMFVLGIPAGMILFAALRVASGLLDDFSCWRRQVRNAISFVQDEEFRRIRAAHEKKARAVSK